MRTDTVALRAGFILSVTADALATGSYLRQSDAGGSYSATDIAASSTTTIGPFTTDRNYTLTSYTGALAYSIAQADYGTTGTGSAVRATAPAISSPTISGGTSSDQRPVANLTADGAITITDGIVTLSKSGVLAATLAAPTAGQEGIILRVTSKSANAHTITATGLIQDGVTGGAKDTATFAAFVGASIMLMAINLKWHVLSLNACTVS